MPKVVVSESRAGLRFGKLTVVSLVGKQGIHYKWLCKCDCGGSKEVFWTNLKQGKTISCGCVWKTVSEEEKVERRRRKEEWKRLHPFGVYRKYSRPKNDPTRNSWRAMIQRCTSKNHWKYERYGGRGIKVCERWMNFENFIADMGERPVGKTIDRVDNNGNYEPSNCRWATAKEQSNNH